MDPLALLMLAGALLCAWGVHRYQRARERELDARRPRYEDDAEVAMHVASHAALVRGHRYLTSFHLLYGLLQDQAIVAAIRRTGGDAAAAEGSVVSTLDTLVVTEQTAEQAGQLLARAHQSAQQLGRHPNCADLWAGLSRPDGEAAMTLARAGIRGHAVLFSLAHGSDEPELPAGSGEVAVVLHNDDYTSQDFVCWLLEIVFSLPRTTSVELMQATHTTGRAVVGRLPADAARAKVLEARRLARSYGFPLWVAVE